MSDFDNDIALALDRAGVRTLSGHHVPADQGFAVFPPASSFSCIHDDHGGCPRPESCTCYCHLKVGQPYKGGLVEDIVDCGNYVEVDLDRAVDSGDGLSVTGFVIRKDVVVRAIDRFLTEPEPTEPEDFHGPDPWNDRRDNDR